MKIGGIILVILGLLCLPQGLIFIVPGVILFLLSQKRKQAANSTSGPAPSHSRSGAQNLPPVPPVTITPDLPGSLGSSFGCWDISIHGVDGQDVRMDRALFQNIVIRSYDPATGTAEIQGTQGDLYQTSLDGCTCEDFQRRGLPCKHIYKLALSRGYSADAFFSARSDVVWYADGCRVYHASPDCRGLRSRYARRSTVSMAEYNGLRPCKTCCGDQ